MLQGSVDAGVVVGAVGVAAGLLGWFTGRRAERRNYRLGASAFTADWHRDLRSWASEGVDSLSRGVYCASRSASSTQMSAVVRDECCSNLSALVDRGRFFLPNYNPDEVGLDKPSAFRGFRHPAIDFLVAAHDVVEDPARASAFSSQRDALIAIKREFVSEIQDLLDPRSRNKAVAKLIKATRADPAEKRTALERLIQERRADS